MRIAFLGDPLDRQYGGIHVYTRELLNALSLLNTDNEFFVLRSEAKRDIDNMNEVVLPYHSFPGYRLWRLFFQVPRILKKLDVDIVVELAHFGPFNLPLRMKRVTVIHDMTVFLFPKYHVFFSQLLQRKLLPRIIKRADYIITNSESTSNDVISFFPSTKHKILSIPLGIDNSFKPVIDVNILKKYGIDSSYLLYVGTLEPRKNIVRIIEAYEKFKKETGKLHKLILIGKKGWKSEKIFESIKNSKFKEDIRCLGYVNKEELPIFYSMAQAFVYPSIYEGFGLPVLEAMACGVPVITSNVSSIPEVGGAAVLYTDPYSIDEIATHMVTLCTKPDVWNNYSQLGLIQSKKFSWYQTALSYHSFFKTINNK